LENAMIKDDIRITNGRVNFILFAKKLRSFWTYIFAKIYGVSGLNPIKT